MLPGMSRSPVLPAALLSLLVGAISGGVLGYTGHALFSPQKVVVPPPEIIKEEISDADLLALCQELTQAADDKVKAAQSRVSTLQQQLAEKEAELETLRQQADKDEATRAVARKKWREMEQEVASLRVQLAEAEAERDQLREDLKQTLRDLDRQIAETQRFKAKAIQYKQESTKNLWSAFGANAKVEICDRGTRKRHDNCHEAVEAALAPIQSRFVECVDTYQAVPVLKQAERNEGLPQFAEALADDNKFTRKGWYIIFCDPTLPETPDEDVPLIRPDDQEDDGLPDFEDEE